LCTARIRFSCMVEGTHALEWFHLARSAVWVLLVPVVLLTTLKEAVWFVILLSLYANFAGDVSAWQAARVERRMKADKAERDA
jgi:hypothetical protein